MVFVGLLRSSSDEEKNTNTNGASSIPVPAELPRILGFNALESSWGRLNIGGFMMFVCFLVGFLSLKSLELQAPVFLHQPPLDFSSLLDEVLSEALRHPCAQAARDTVGEAEAAAADDENVTFESLPGCQKEPCNYCLFYGSRFGCLQGKGGDSDL